MERSPRPSSSSLKRGTAQDSLKTSMTSPRASLAKTLPALDFENPFSNPGHYSSASTFLPLHMEKGYAYPLFVWLSGTGKGEFRLSKVMPKISLRNYIGIAPELGSPANDLPSEPKNEVVFECLDKACIQYNINSSRIFLAGAGEGGQLALNLAMTHSDYFAGVISLGGEFPQNPSLMGDLRSVRKTPVFMAQSREDETYDENAFCEDLKMLHVGGFSVTARQYPGAEPLMDQMLHDIDVWMMEIINGYDMTASSDQTTHEFN